MHVITTAEHDAAVATLDGRLDLRSAPGVRLQGAAALASARGRLVLDLRAVTFIDSSGLGVLVGLHREAARLGGGLTILPPSGPAREIFALTRTESFFRLVETMEDARVTA